MNGALGYLQSLRQFAGGYATVYLQEQQEGKQSISTHRCFHFFLVILDLVIILPEKYDTRCQEVLKVSPPYTKSRLYSGIT